MSMTVRELLERMGSDEITEWIAFYQLEPFGEMRADYRSGVIASTVANVHRAKDTLPFRAEDFMPFYEKQPSNIDPQVNIARFKAMFTNKVIKNHG